MIFCTCINNNILLFVMFVKQQKSNWVQSTKQKVNILFINLIMKSPVITMS